MVYEHILIASGGAEHSQRAEERAVQLARATNAKLSLLSVVRERDAPAPEVLVSERLADQQRRQQQQELTEASERLRRHGLQPETHLRIGDAGRRIIETAAELGCDLIVVGSRHLSVVGSLTRGSVSDYVTRHAASDVLIVH